MILPLSSQTSVASQLLPVPAGRGLTNSSLDVRTGDQFHDAVLVQSATGFKLGLYDSPLIAEVGSLEESCIAVLLSLLTLSRQQKQHPVTQGHAIHAL